MINAMSLLQNPEKWTIDNGRFVSFVSLLLFGVLQLPHLVLQLALFFLVLHLTHMNTGN
jgi:hypothetical protein